MSEPGPSNNDVVNAAAAAAPAVSPPAAPDYMLYHEPQQAALCGVHALNTLLQGPVFSAMDLGEIAQQLDADEHALMAAHGVESADFLRFAAEDSSNVDASGMFSIQVLAKALEVWGLQAVPITHPDASTAKAAPQNFDAFLCNLQEHWFTLRKVSGEWWNLNSLYAHPEPLSQFYLAAFLASLMEQGYTIFLIRGSLPPPDPSRSGNDGAEVGHWLTSAAAREAAKATAQLKQSGFVKAAAKGLQSMASAAGTRMLLRRRDRSPLPGSAGQRSSSGVAGIDDDDDEDVELQRALAASREESEGMRGAGFGSGSGFGDDAFEDDPELAAAIAASMADAAPPPATQEGAEGTPEAMEVETQAGNSLDGSVVAAAADAFAAATAEVPQLEEEPAADAEGVVEVGVKLPDGKRVSRRFAAGAAVGQVVAFAAESGVDMCKHRLATTFPRKVLADWEQSLAEAGVRNKDMVFCEPN